MSLYYMDYNAHSACLIVFLCSYYSTVPVFFYKRGGNIHLIIIIQDLSYHILRFEVPSNALLVYISTLSSALHMYVCIYVWSSHIAEYGSTGQGCQSCSWSAEQGKIIFPCPRACLRIWSRDTSSALPSRVQPSRPASACSFSILRLNLVLTYEISAAEVSSLHRP